MTKMTSTKDSRIALVQFPGSNCDRDCIDVFQRHFSLKVQTVWHTETRLPAVDAVILPGGFSYGDYLRGGALASHSPLMAEVKSFADRGGAIIGICNGFQILTEVGLLPGALLRNDGQRFVCREVDLQVGEGSSVYQKTLGSGPLTIPVAHGEGRYYVDAEGLKSLQDKGQIAFRYQQNPNGSVDDIAGVVSENGRVLGMMPHPERAADETLTGGSRDGLKVWEAFLATFL